MDSRGLVLGIDLTASHRRPSAYAVLDADSKVRGLGFLATDADILHLAQETRSIMVAIDCPLGLPAGLCCLEEECPCRPSLPRAGRSAERELARMGIGSYFTTKRSIIKAMVYRGMGLKRELERQGCPALEVYPYASKVLLFGPRPPKKTTPAGLAFLRERLVQLIPTLAPYSDSLDHDLSDAVMAAYTACLYLRGDTVAVGAAEEGQVVVPRRQAGSR